MEMVFVSGEIAAVRHLVDANPVETKVLLPGTLSQNGCNNSENEHKTFKLFVLWSRHVVVYNKRCVDILVIDYRLILC